ncbi:hypothetical protein AA0522_1889 [Gluconacetobacter liquefaciens NRIC 0522]|uniref:Polyisoprenoid-binding protein YceI n=2 Tax=Gluconacetobacter liquefaciens TaxID=89584 RepID=A0A370FX06_GLULI|nr:YceI family protein [Gluconacetobacter liquefaciens]RDI36102.1 polyisoprenoid-binding protein YceI [Gluconacetobacter liquefaciens]GBR04468.1 hypothetical protein AA0522_1889 [Gluconacetobacter liquefaciens NRIC 0522]
MSGRGVCVILLAAMAMGFSGARVAVAAPQVLVLNPGNTEARLHARSALTDIDGSFAGVSGRLQYDLDRQTCHVDLTMDVGSLKVGSAVMKQIMLSGIMLDSDAHPTMRYVGECRPRIVGGEVHSQLVGTLTMRGKTHPVTFETQMRFSGNTLHQIVSNATFDQRLWGVSTLLHSVDPMVRSETVITLK